MKVIGQLDRLCTKDNADEVVGKLLRQFDVVTGLPLGPIPKHQLKHTQLTQLDTAPLNTGSARISTQSFVPPSMASSRRTGPPRARRPDIVSAVQRAKSVDVIAAGKAAASCSTRLPQRRRCPWPDVRHRTLRPALLRKDADWQTRHPLPTDGSVAAARRRSRLRAHRRLTICLSYCSPARSRVETMPPKAWPLPTSSKPRAR